MDQREKETTNPPEKDNRVFSPTTDTLKITREDYLQKVSEITLFEEGKEYAEFIYKSNAMDSGWEINEKEERIFVNVDRFNPRLRIGTEEYMKFLYSEMKYPKEARRKGHTGRVYLNLKIDSSGVLVGIEVMNPEHVDPVLQLEAVRVLSRYDMGFYPAEDRSGMAKDGQLRQAVNFM